MAIVATDRVLDIFAIIERRERTDTFQAALCGAAAEFMALDGASIVLTGDDGVLTTLCSSSEVARSLLDIELVLGEGPTVEACRGTVVSEADLLDASLTRWSTYTSQAVAIGVRAVFAYSIRVGAVRFGALSLFRFVAGPLSASQEGDAYLMASVIARAILAHEARGGIVGDLGGDSVLDFSVHQAAGMIAVQGSMSVRDALVSLRAHAFATNTGLAELAGRVVSRETRYEEHSSTWVNGADEQLRER